MHKATLSIAFSGALLALSAGAHAAESAQEDGSTSIADYRGGAGYGVLGYRPLDLGAEAGDAALSMGGGGHFQRGRLLFGGEGHGIIGVVGDDEDNATKLSSGYGFARVGGVVLQTSHFSIYPLLGVGGGAVTVGEDSEAVGGLLFDGAIGIDYRIINPFDRGGRGFVLVGLRGGDTFARFDGDWSVEGGASSGLTGPYLRLVLGAGGQR